MASPLLPQAEKFKIQSTLTTAFSLCSSLNALLADTLTLETLKILQSETETLLADLNEACDKLFSVHIRSVLQQDFIEQLATH